MTMTIPPHLAINENPPLTYGTLKRYGGVWLIEGEPQVAVDAKRLFPGSAGMGNGVAKFPANTRSFADLVWLMQKWPLVIADDSRAEFDSQYAETLAFVQRRDKLMVAPPTSKPKPTFNGTLRQYQEEGLGHMMAIRRTLLADDMGLGKTPQALAFLATAEDWPALIVVQPHLIDHWERRAGQFLGVVPSDLPLMDTKRLTIHTLKGRKASRLPPAHIFLTHYGLLRSWREALMEAGVQTVIFDEVQELRHKESQKYSAASEISQSALNCVGLSGTPIYNRGGEIWNVLNAVDMHCLGDWDSFTREWCTGYGSDTVTDADLLGRHLRRQGLMLRRMKDDVMSELPPKRQVLEYIDADDGLFRSLIVNAQRLARQAATTDNPWDRGRLEEQAMQETRRATGVAKAEAAVEFIAALLEAGEPTLVFTHHHDVNDVLAQGLSRFKPAFITGKQSPGEKVKAQHRFEEGETDCCIIALRAATGIDGLQHRAKVVVFVELDWSPAVHSQAEDRAHRDGQRDSVLAYYLVCRVGTDPDMMEALGLKIAQAKGLMGDKAATEEDKALAQSEAGKHMAKVMEKLREGR